jgi:quinoprotein glucose dehydrogenase
VRPSLTGPLGLAACLGLGAAAQEPFVPPVAPASNEAREAMARFKVPDGFQVELVAAEPMLANPVCLYVDFRGDLYVGETFRHHKGVTDIRDHMDWNDDDLAARTVEDRVAYFRRHLGDKFAEYERACERVRLLRDTNGDGVADMASVFADRFDSAADGIGASLLSYKGDVFYTCIPNLWRLRDEDGDGRADLEQVLSSGYGVHVALLGHDLHGLRIGPDGKLYFSIGDRGFNVPLPGGGRLEHPETGGVLRCNLDGSELEVFALGLRNPQDLVFDAFGNLFTGDNNSDGGDQARVVHVVEGSDAGWRQSYQWLVEPNLRGPWNDERLWIPHFAGQAAYIVPPIANLANGPSGLALGPGTGFPERYTGRFFLCDFTGDPGTSKIHGFALSPQNAGFALAEHEEFVRGSLVTDCDFGPDGALYFSDWTQGWNQTDKGRVYRVFDPSARASSAARETRRLLGEGQTRRPDGELVALLAHADQRVRQEAQFELAARGANGRRILEQAAGSSSSLLARVHAIWGLGMVLRRPDARDSESAEVLLALLDDADGEVRAQAARVLGDLREPRAAKGLIGRLCDREPRPRLYAAIGLGRIRSPLAVAPLFELVRQSGESDPVLRHAAIFGLAGCASVDELVAAQKEVSRDVRIAAVVALRRRGSPEVARFLHDSDPQVEVEAARAINDVPIPAAMPALAARIRDAELSGNALVRRVINANFRIGGDLQAHGLASLALRSDQEPRLRVEALDRLAEWAKPSNRDAVIGEWRPLAPRPPEMIHELAMQLDHEGIGSAPDEVLVAWTRLVAAHHVIEMADALELWVLDAKRAGCVRCAALRALASLTTPRRATVEAALFDSDGDLRAEALELVPKIAPTEALTLLQSVLDQGETRERRAALRTLASLEDRAVEPVLSAQLDRMAAGLFPEELALDLALAAEGRHDAGLDAKLAAWRAPRAADPLLAPWLDSLHGGNPERGRKLFREREQITCLRCHRIETEGDAVEGGEVGPPLRGVGGRLSRLQLLESICAPNRRVANGFQSTVLRLTDETLLDGRILSEQDGRLTVLDAEGVAHEIASEEVVSRRSGLSAMPDGLTQYLSREDMRDLIEFLSRL